MCMVDNPEGQSCQLSIHCVQHKQLVILLTAPCTCSNYENQGCTFGRPLWPDLDEAASLSDEEGAVAAAAAGGAVLGSSKLLGRQPGTEVPVLLKRGPFGLYVQLVRPARGAASAVGLLCCRQCNSYLASELLVGALC